MSEPSVRTRLIPGDRTPRASNAANSWEDPMAELARLVGRDDPFRGLFTRRQDGEPHETFADQEQGAGIEAARATYRHEGEAAFADQEGHAGFDEGRGTHARSGDLDAQLRGTLNGSDYQRQVYQDRPDALRFPPIEQAEADYLEPHGHLYDDGAQRGGAPALNADLWAEGAMDPNGETPAGFEEDTYALQNGSGSSRRTLIVLAAVLFLTGGGLGATFRGIL